MRRGPIVVRLCFARGSSAKKAMLLVMLRVPIRKFAVLTSQGTATGGQSTEAVLPVAVRLPLYPSIYYKAYFKSIRYIGRTPQSPQGSPKAKPRLRTCAQSASDESISECRPSDTVNAEKHLSQSGVARGRARQSQTKSVILRLAPPTVITRVSIPCAARSASPSSATSLQPWNMQKPISWRSK